MAEMYY